MSSTATRGNPEMFATREKEKIIYSREATSRMPSTKPATKDEENAGAPVRRRETQKLRHSSRQRLL